MNIFAFHDWLQEVRIGNLKRTIVMTKAKLNGLREGEGLVMDSRYGNRIVETESSLAGFEYDLEELQNKPKG